MFSPLHFSGPEVEKVPITKCFALDLVTISVYFLMSHDAVKK
jgi:hypothetical protein